jgi:cytochrome c peroxidase
MTRVLRGAVVLAVAAIVAIASAAPHRGRLVWDQGLDALAATLRDLETALARADSAGARSAFRAARRDYKRIEGLLYFHSPILTADINSPRIDDDDAPNPLPLATPIGFQVIESALFDGEPSLDSARLETSRMRWVVGQFQLLARHTRVTDTTLLEAARLELARVTTLGLAGFDAGSSGDAIREAAEALEGLRQQLGTVHAPDSLKRTADAALDRAIGELRSGGDPETLNRLRFITGFAEPAAQAIDALRRSLRTPPPGARPLWRHDAPSVFASHAFDPAGYAPAHARQPTPTLIALGERLFFEPRLSGPGTHSCAFCHDPKRAFTDGQPRAKALPGVRTPPLRNTPTLLNAAFQPTLFADDRARSFEAQAGVVLTSPAEMASSPELVASRLNEDPSYRKAFARAMPDRGDSAITALEIRQALAAYERTLVALDSRFDRALRGDTLALSAQERAGFTVFLGKGRCGTCHFVPLFNGVQPPDFKTGEPEIIGVTAGADPRHPRLDPDLGRGGVDLISVSRFAFKVPTLRNIALTAPYMHNGAFPTLESVVDFYDAGGGAGLGADVKNPTLAPDSLHLTKPERLALVAFLCALTDTTIPQRPKS